MAAPWRLDAHHVPLATIRRTARHFKGIDAVQLTGGEPLLHPQFGRIAAGARQWYGCRQLGLQTNGTLLDRWPDALGLFDLLLISDYGLNGGDIAGLRDRLTGTKTQILSGTPYQVPRDQPGGRMCERGRSGIITCYEDRLWPCCEGPGLNDAPSIPITANWQDEIGTVPMPCERCFLAGDNERQGLHQSSKPDRS